MKIEDYQNEIGLLLISKANQTQKIILLLKMSLKGLFKAHIKDFLKILYLFC